MRLLLVPFAAAQIFAASPALNVSHDLTTLNIASQNMTPNLPALDSRPLLEAAVQYAQAHTIPLITSDPGNYYILTGHANSGRFFSFNGLQNLTFDFAQSDFYFALGSWVELECDSCQNVQFLNFTMDALQLPYTQVKVTSVDTTAKRIYYSAIAGWEAATDFNTVRNPAGSAEPLYAFDFRNGLPMRGTARMAVQRPIDPAFLSIASDGSPWSNPAQLASVLPGDIVALEARGGGPAMAIRNGSNIVIQNVAIYSSGQVGLMLQSTPNTLVSQVQIVPRPGTDRLVSTNADGISAVQLGENLRIQRCRVKRTGDDGISPNSQSLALVTAQPAANQVTVNRNAYQTFANGLAVQFIDNKTGFPVVTAHIVSQDPPYSATTPVFGSAATITFDQNIPALAAKDPMIYADPAFRGNGLLLQNNLVEEGAFARGMSIWGIMNANVRGNVIRNTSWSAINLLESLSPGSWVTGPVANVTLQRNAIEQFTSAFGTAVVDAFGGISIGADDLNFNLITSGSPFQNVSVTDNFINTGPYSGIRMENVNGGAISGNLLMNVAGAPTVNNPSASFVSQLSQPVAVVSSVNVTQTPNTVDTRTAPAVVTSAVSFSNEAVATDSWVAVKGTNLAPQTDIASVTPLPAVFDGVSVTVTDSTGTAYPAGVWFISSSQINFLMPAGTAPGAAYVTVAVNGVPTGRGAILNDSLAPALFAADGSGAGPALGSAVLTLASGAQIITPLPQPVDLGQSGDILTLVLYASGIRHLDSPNNVAIYIGNQRLPVAYAGAQGTFAGLDQINVTLPQSLKGAGVVALHAVVNGLSSNSVTVNLQ